MMMMILQLSRCQCAQISALRDGVLIEKQGAVHLEGGRWRVITSLEEPIYPAVDDHVQTVRATIHNLAPTWKNQHGTSDYG